MGASKVPSVHGTAVAPFRLQRGLAQQRSRLLSAYYVSLLIAATKHLQHPPAPSPATLEYYSQPPQS